MQNKLKTPKNKATSKPPTLAEIADALEVTVRTVSTLKRQNMPTHSIKAALAWREAQAGDDTVIELRKRRIAVLKQQERLAKISADEKAGLLVSKEFVADEHRKIAYAISAHLRRIETDLPQLCLGLDLSRSKPLVKKFIRETQLQVAQNHPDFWPDKLPDGWEL